MRDYVCYPICVLFRSIFWQIVGTIGENEDE